MSMALKIMGTRRAVLSVILFTFSFLDKIGGFWILGPTHKLVGRTQGQTYEEDKYRKWGKHATEAEKGRRHHYGIVTGTENMLIG